MSFYYNNNLDEIISQLFEAKTDYTNQNNNSKSQIKIEHKLIKNEEPIDEFFSNNFKKLEIIKGDCDICSIDLSNKISYIDISKNLKVCLDHFDSFTEFIKKNIKIHEHQLKGLKIYNFECFKCKKNYTQKFGMKCEKCNFILCFNCYIPNKKPTLSGIYISHFHNIHTKNENNQNKIYNCDNCNGIIKRRYRCGTCKFNLCEICVKNLLNCLNNKHNHNSILTKKNTNCLECRKKKELFMSCYYLDCKYDDICLDCYFNDSNKNFSSINDFYLENIFDNKIIVSSHFILPHLHKAFINYNGTIYDIKCNHCNKININYYCPECCLCLCDFSDLIPYYNTKTICCTHYLFLDKNNQKNNYKCLYDKFPQVNYHSDIFMVCNKCNVNICLYCFENKAKELLKK